MNHFMESEWIRAFIENLEILDYQLDAQGRWKKLGELCLPFTGFMPPEVVSEGFSWLNRIHPEDALLYEEARKELWEKGSMVLQYRFKKADGSVGWFSDTAKRVLDEDGNVQGASGCIQEITTWKETECELNMIKSAINSAHNGIIIVDARIPSMPIIFANHAFEEMTGYNIVEIIGKNCRFLQKQDRNQEGVVQIREAVRQGRKANVMLRNYKKNGELFYNHIFISPVKNKNGVLTHFIGVQYDVTEKVELQHKLKAYYEKEKYLRTVLSTIADLNKMVGTAKNSNFLFRNLCQKLMDIQYYQFVWVGLVDDASIGKEYYLGKNGISDERKNSYREDLHRVIKETDQLDNVQKQRDRVLGHSLLIPMVHQLKSSGQLGWLMIYSNHESGFMEEEVTMLQDLTATISAAIEYQRMDQLMFYHARQAAMGELIGHMAHQWRQPINELGLILQDLRDAYLCQELDEAYLKSSTKEGMELLLNMSTTIDDFRLFFSGGHKKEAFRLAEVIQQSVSLIGPHFKKYAIDIEVVEEDPVVIQGYAREFAQVVLNLLNNSRDALLRRKPKEPRILIHVKQEGNIALMTLEDNGGGIPESAKGHIFDQYFSTKSDHQGAGLGLYISKMIIEHSMAGKITSLNTDDGVRFRVEVPQ